MSEFTVNDTFKASADVVWKEFADFGGIGDWAPGVESCDVEGEGIGSVRTVAMAGGVEMKERLDVFDDAARTLSYAIVGGPLPVSNYLATVKVTEEGDGCRVDWGASFDPPEGVPAEAIGKGVSGAYAGMLKALKARLGEA